MVPLKGEVVTRATARAVLLVFCAALVSPPAAADPPRVQPATLARVRGAVQVKAPGGNWRRPNERERISPGTQVKTGTNGEVILRLSERNIVRLGPDTDFTLQAATVRREDAGARVGPFRQQQNSYQYEMDLNEGTATSLLRGLGTNSQYNIRTPVAVAGVRGTIFTATVRRNDGSGNSPSNVASDNSNVGEGNRGQGVGNTGPGNQGDGPNEGTAGNAGGGGNITADFTVIEGSLEVTTGSGGGDPIIVDEGFTLSVDNAPAPPPGDAGAPADGGDGAGSPAPAPVESTGGDAATTEGDATNINTNLVESTANEEALTNEVISLPNIQAEIQLRVGTSSGGTGICE